MWRSGQWRTLLNLIDHMPRASFTRQAFAEDDEHVSAIIDAMERTGDRPDNAPSIAEYDGTAERLDEVIDTLKSLLTVFIASNQEKGKKAPQFPQRPRPTSSFERLQHQRRMAQHRKTVARVKGMKRPPAE